MAGVIPCQSYYKRIGNILTDGWDAIWNHPLSRYLRTRQYATEECRECAEFDICGAACPLEQNGEEMRITPHNQHLGT
jgi:radical SAM protein with 4Fe4S-binding SPASM domain